MNDIEIVIIKRAKMDRKTKERVEANRAKGMCIVCGQKPVHKRDACTTCHGRYISNMPQSNKTDQAKYEAACEAQGLIGPNRQGQRLDFNPYKDLAAQIESGKAGSQ